MNEIQVTHFADEHTLKRVANLESLLKQAIHYVKRVGNGNPQLVGEAEKLLGVKI